MTIKSMTESQERRASGIERISLTTLIDICGLDEAAMPFQAESDNISGRGMRVKTSHLPEIGEDLVCRFEREGKEILVEGKVAWRTESEESGEFGVQFTALDAASAEILQSLEHSHSAQPSEAEDCLEEAHLESGARVRMHIDGLAAPMKAAVVEGNERKLRVGSSLEFLKIGQSLELEDQASGDSRGARVDMVNVVVNPATSIPELVVQLRYEGAEVSPQPPQANELEADFEDESFLTPAALSRSAASSDSEPRLDAFEAEPERWEPAAEMLRERLGGAASAASEAAKAAGGMMSKWAEQAGSVASSAAEHAQAQLKTMRSQKEESGKGNKGATRNSRQPMPERSVKAGETPLRRSQRSTRRGGAPSAHLRSGIHDRGLLSQKRSRKPELSDSKEMPVAHIWKRRASLGAGALAVISLVTWGVNSAVSDSETVNLPLGQQGEALPAMTEVNRSPKEIQADTSVLPPSAAPGSRFAQQEVVAEIPLFGQQTLGKATALSRTTPGTPAVTTLAPAAEKAREFSSGKLLNPTVYQIRLDGAGQQLIGTAHAEGFSVVVPQRKTIESGRGIERSDRRIDHVKTMNTSEGTRVSFEFSTAVPGYRVTLRDDLIQFAISSPASSIAGL